MKAWVAVAITVACLLVSLGYNWRRVDEVANAQAEDHVSIKAMSEQIARTDAWQQVSSTQYSVLRGQLDEIKALLNPPRRAFVSGSDTPDSPIGRRFDK